MTPKEKSQINILLAYLRQFSVVQLVTEYFARYNNDAPSSLLKEQIDTVQKLLEKKP